MMCMVTGLICVPTVDGFIVAMDVFMTDPFFWHGKALCSLNYEPNDSSSLCVSLSLCSEESLTAVLFEL